MPSFQHNGFVQLFRSHPALVSDLLRDVLHVDVPAHTKAALVDSVLDQLAPTELRADLVIELKDEEDRPKLAVVTEVQLDSDDAKLYSWPAYHVLLRLRRRCDACVLVVTPFEKVAAWASRPIDLGPGNAGFRVLVLGPRQMPAIVDPAAVAANPALAILTVMAHGNEEGGVPVLWATLEAVPRVDSDNRAVYLRLIDRALSDTLRAGLMKAIAAMQESSDMELPAVFQGLVDWGEAKGEAKGKAEGEARGEAKTLLRILDHHGVVLTPEQRATIASCRDLARLDAWIERSFTARTADELFA